VLASVRERAWRRDRKKRSEEEVGRRGRKKAGRRDLKKRPANLNQSLYEYVGYWLVRE